MRIFRIAIMGVFLIGLAVGPASATINTYNSLSSWNAAVQSPVTIDFNTLNANYVSSVPMTNVTFTPITTGFLLTGQANWYAACDVKCLATDNSGSNRSLLATHAAGMLAFGLNIWVNSPTPSPVTVRVFLAGNSTTTPDSSTDLTTNSMSSAPIFFGAASDVAIQKVEILSGNPSNNIVIDNYALSTALAQVTGGGGNQDPPVNTPEVPTLGYVGIGFLALIYGSRRRIAK